MKELDRTMTQVRIRQIGLEHPSVPAFGYLDEAANTRYDWHQHPYHQLLYSLSGTAQLEVGSVRYFLPPQRAAWISAGTLHRTTIGDLSGASVFFEPHLITWPVEAIRVFAAPPLLRAMVQEAMRWEANASAADDLRDPYFRTLALLCRDWMRKEEPYWLPSSRDPQLAQALDYTLQNLDSATLEQASARAAMSVRSFRRHFTAELGLTWRDYLSKARLLRAMDLLTGPNAHVAEVASRVGFDSPSAFSKAFGEFTHETPREYQARVRSFAPVVTGSSVSR